MRHFAVGVITKDLDMKELKFRAWWEDQRIFIAPMTIQQMIHQQDNEFTLKQINEWLEFEQYTGLSDIEDTELYINDIVKVDYDLMSKNDTGLRVIRFMEGALRLLEYDYFEDDNVAKWTDWQVLHQGYIKEYKIVKVGNLHENGDLLK